MSNLRSCRTIREGNFCPALCKADDTDPKSDSCVRREGARFPLPGEHQSRAHAYRVHFFLGCGQIALFNRDILLEHGPAELRVGGAAWSWSSADRFLLRSGMPTPAQIAVWDRIMVPPFRWVDPLLAYRVGKSILGVWRNRPS
jgi:hypothetical protein